MNQIFFQEKYKGISFRRVSEEGGGGGGGLNQIWFHIILHTPLDFPTSYTNCLMKQSEDYAT